jgi:hypothetical protein
MLLFSARVLTFLLLFAFFVGAQGLGGGATTAWPALAAGVLVAFGALVRPIAYYLPVAIIAGLFVLGIRAGWSRGRLARVALAFAAPCVVLLGGWQLRNYVAAGTAEFSTVIGRTLLMYQGAAIVARRDGISLEEARKRLADSVPGRDCTAPRSVEYCKQATVSLITDHPALFLVVQVEGLARILIAPGVSQLTTMLGLQTQEETRNGDPVLLDLARLNLDEYARKWLIQRPARLAVTAFGLIYLVVIYGGVAIFLLAKGARKPGTGRAVFVCMGGYVLYMLLFSAIPDADSRFRVPVMPFLVVFSVLGYQHARLRLGAKRPLPGRQEFRNPVVET